MVSIAQQEGPSAGPSCPNSVHLAPCLYAAPVRRNIFLAYSRPFSHPPIEGKLAWRRVPPATRWPGGSAYVTRSPAAGRRQRTQRPGPWQANRRHECTSWPPDSCPIDRCMRSCPAGSGRNPCGVKARQMARVHTDDLVRGMVLRLAGSTAYRLRVEPAQHLAWTGQRWSGLTLPSTGAGGKMARTLPQSKGRPGEEFAHKPEALESFWVPVGLRKVRLQKLCPSGDVPQKAH